MYFILSKKFPNEKDMSVSEKRIFNYNGQIVFFPGYLPLIELKERGQGGLIQEQQGRRIQYLTLDPPPQEERRMVFREG